MGISTQLRTAAPQTTSATPPVARPGAARLWRGLLEGAERAGPVRAEAPDAGFAGPASPEFGHDFARIRVHPLELRRACSCGGRCEACDARSGDLRVSRPNASFAKHGDYLPPIVQETLSSPGRPLDSATRAFVEPRFGHDFSNVSVHAGAKATESARAINAAAYTVGNHIVLGSPRSAGDAHGGFHSLAHELAHVVQQRRGGPFSPRAGSGSLEQAADAAASTLTAGEGPVHVSGACAPGLARQPETGGPGPGIAESDDGVAVWRVENEDGTWSALNSRGEVLGTGPLGPVVDPNLPDMYSTVVVGKRDEAARKAALRQWADPAWSDPLSPIREPESYDPEIYDPDVLARKAAERKFDEYDRKEYGAHGVIFKRGGSGRVYANDIAAEDYKELTERYNINVSTDPDRVVLPIGIYAFESVYEGKLLKKIMEENKLPPEAIHQVAAQLEAEIEGGASLRVAGTGTARFAGQSRSFAPPPRKAPGRLGRAYLKVRLAAGLGGQGLDRAGANPTIGAGGGAARPVPALQQPSTAGARITAPAPPVAARPTPSAPYPLVTPNAPAPKPTVTAPPRAPVVTPPVAYRPPALAPVVPTGRRIVVTVPAKPKPASVADPNAVRQGPLSPAEERIRVLANRDVYVGVQAKVKVEGKPVTEGLGGAAFGKLDATRGQALGGTGRAAVLPEVSLPAGTPAKKGSQPSSGVVVEPAKGSTEVEVLAWNTGAPQKGANVSHAERQVIDWFRSRDAKWIERVKSVDIEVYGRQICTMCDSDLKALQKAYPHIKFNFVRRDTGRPLKPPPAPRRNPTQ